MHRQRQSRTSTSKFRQNFRELIRLSLILATHMLMLPSGRQKQKILLQDSLRTSRNTRAMNSEKHLLQQVRRSKIQKYLKQQLCRMRRKGRYCIAYAVSSFSAVSSGQYTFFSRSAILQQTFIQIGRDRSFIDYLSFPVSRDGTVVGRVPVLFLPFEIRFSGLEKKAAGRLCQSVKYGISLLLLEMFPELLDRTFLYPRDIRTGNPDLSGNFPLGVFFTVI